VAAYKGKVESLKGNTVKTLKAVHKHSYKVKSVNPAGAL
jgi:hypothetical protein